MTGTFNVLVVSGGSFQGQALLKGLAASAQVRSVLADCFDQTVGGYLAHRAYTVPRVADEGEFIAALLAICARERIEVVFPSTDIELAALAANRTAFDDLGIRVAVSAPAWLEVVADKRRLYTFLAENGFPVLPLAVPWSPDAAFPLLGKPRQGWGGRGHVRVHSPTEWLALDREALRSGYVWQPYLDGADEYSVDFAIDFQGRLSALSIRKRVRTVGGFAVIAAADDDAQSAALAQRLAALTVARGGCGIFNVQVLSHRGRRYVSDVNARIGTSAVFAFEEGINLPLFVCALSPPADVPRAGTPRTGMPRTMVRRLVESFYVPTRLDDVVAVVFDLDDTLLKHKSWILDKVERAHANFDERLPPLGVFLPKALELLESGHRHRLFDALA
ncbi:MAG TPA: ATP-grasp domain-containing protein, partial [Pirellulales bacterium]|nr:ATP-grasp domain-containing protein [Pirellulales bacterium]